MKTFSSLFLGLLGIFNVSRLYAQPIHQIKPFGMLPKEPVTGEKTDRSISFDSNLVQNFVCLEWLFPSECQTLLRLYQSIVGASWVSDVKNSWFVSKNVCSWEGVTCSPKAQTCEENLILRNVPASCEWVKYLPNPYSPNRLFRFRLRGNHLPQLPKDAFSGLSHLLFLDLGKNQIRTLSEQTFSGLVSLQELSLWGNEIELLPNLIFQDLSSLKNLFLFQNRLKTLPQYLFEKLSQIEQISLAQNQIGQLPNSLFFSNQKLQKLQLQENQMKTLPGMLFQKNNELKELVLYRNQIQRLPSHIFSSLHQLKRLFLQKNKLRHLSKKLLKELHSLEEVSFAENQLEDLPKDFFVGLPKLRSIDLQKNPNLKWKIPKELCGKPDLEIRVEHTKIIPCMNMNEGNDRN